jgi:hypothetical protein
MDTFYQVSPAISMQETIFRQLISLFNAKRLPYRPYCTDDLAFGIKPNNLQKALEKSYIQINPPSQCFWLIFDVDHNLGAFAWEKANLPPPCWVAVNPENGHSHIVYALKHPVTTSEFAHKKPLQYLAAIEQGFIAALNSDPNYVGLITKNPTSEKWHVFGVLNYSYELDELAEWVSINHPHKSHQKASECSSLGRNCYLFDKLRKWSYQAVRKHRGGDYKTWHAEVLSKAHEYNEFSTPLITNEVKAIAKSIANWVWRKDSDAEIKFKCRQVEKGRRGGLAKGAKNHNKRISAKVLKNSGIKVSEIARTLDVSQTTIKRWLKC